MPPYLAAVLDDLLAPGWREDGRLLAKLNKLWERYPLEATWRDAIMLLRASTRGVLDGARVHLALETRLRDVQEGRRGLPEGVRRAEEPPPTWPPEAPAYVRESCERLKHELQAIRRPSTRRSLVPLARAREQAMALVIEAARGRFGGPAGDGGGRADDGSGAAGGAHQA